MRGREPFRKEGEEGRPLGDPLRVRAGSGRLAGIPLRAEFVLSEVKIWKIQDLDLAITNACKRSA